MRRAVLAFAALAVLVPAAPAAAASGVSGLYACNARGSSDTNGAVLGGLLGAFAGSRVSKHYRTLGAVLGAGLGSAIGSAIGCQMDERGQTDARAAFQRALDTGRPQSWTDTRSGATGYIEVIRPAAAAHTGNWRFAKGVTPARRGGGRAAGAYVSGASLALRAGPSPTARVVRRIGPGEQVEVAGGVGAGVWLAVLDGDLIQGYAPASTLRPAPRSWAGAAASGCRLVSQTVTEPGRGQTYESYTACRDGTGSWSLDAV
jgi:surface antigen